MECTNLESLHSLFAKNECNYIQWFAHRSMAGRFDFRYVSKELYDEVMTRVDGLSIEEAAWCSDSGLSVLHQLVRYNYYNALELLLKKGANPDVRGCESTLDKNDTLRGTTPFMIACFMGNFKMAMLLLEYGADTTLCDEYGRNAFHYLAGFGGKFIYECFDLTDSIMKLRIKIMPFLKCDINAVDNEGYTPFQRLVTYRGNVYVPRIRLLVMPFINAGADVMVRDNEGNTTLILAASTDNIARECNKTATYMLASYKELINEQNDKGETALHKITGSTMCYTLAHAIIRKGANSDIPNNEGVTVREYVSEHWKNYTWIFDKDREITDEELKRCAYNIVQSTDWYPFALDCMRELFRRVDKDDDEELDDIRRLVSDFAEEGIEEIIDLLHEYEFDFTALIYSGSSATNFRDELISRLSSVEELFILEKLAAYNIDLNTPCWRDRTPACIYVDDTADDDELPYEAVKYFSLDSFEYYDHTGMAAIHYASKDGAVNKLDAMLKAGVNVNLPALGTSSCKERTPLHYACLRGEVEAVKLLLAFGADESARDTDGNTPAHYALSEDSYISSMECRKELIDCLNVVNLTNNNNETPLMLAQKLYNVPQELIDMLIEKDTDINHADNRGETALLCNLVYRNDTKGAKELIKKGADVNVRDERGNSPLYYAVHNHNIELTRYLLKKGADYKVVNNDGVSIAQLVVENGWMDILKMMPDIAEDGGTVEENVEGTVDKKVVDKKN